MLSKRNVFLIGPMGSGKTAVGRHLARALGFGFHDSDAEIEKRTGVDIPFIFEKEGEEGFRLREREALEQLTQLEPIVLATGGGAVLHPDNRRALAERGRVVYLLASINQQMERTRHGRHRPLLLTGDPRARLDELMREREPLYAGIADFTVTTDGRRVQLVAEDILRLLASTSAAPSQ
jgi:shikimate kinase